MHAYVYAHIANLCRTQLKQQLILTPQWYKQEIKKPELRSKFLSSRSGIRARMALVVSARSPCLRKALSLLTRLNLNSTMKSAASTTPQAQQAQQAQAKSALPPPQMDGTPKEYSAKIQTLVDEIAKLNLIEVADLNDLLRKRLNIKGFYFEHLSNTTRI